MSLSFFADLINPIVCVCVCVLCVCVCACVSVCVYLCTCTYVVASVDHLITASQQADIISFCSGHFFLSLCIKQIQFFSPLLQH